LISILFILLPFQFVWSRTTQVGECLATGSPNIQITAEETKFPKEMSFRCLYSCRLPNGDEELFEANYEYKVSNKSEEISKQKCEGDAENDGIFFSRLSYSTDLKNWANDNQITYEGPYNGQLTKDTLANLLYVGGKLAATKSIVTSRAGQILIKIGNQTEEGKKLFEEYLIELRSGGYQPRGFQTPDDWVLHYIVEYGRHLF
jgi:hypothetical protein